MATSPAPIAAPEITAGAYLRLRREAAGLSRREVAAMIFSDPVGVPAVIAVIEEAETDAIILGDFDLARLSAAFLFVPGIYRCLVDGLPASDICRGCGCSWTDACPGGCAWADASRTLCTTCLRASS